MVKTNETLQKVQSTQLTSNGTFRDVCGVAHPTHKLVSTWSTDSHQTTRRANLMLQPCTFRH